MLFRTLALSAASLAVATAGTTDNRVSIVHVFDADYSGVDGTIIVTYDDLNYGGATIKADLRFASVDTKALKALDGNCTGDRVSEYKWHIHTKWNQPTSHVSSSAKLGECAKAITGDHYDPYKICGPASEFAGSPECAPKVKNYNCTPESYKANFALCEAGDLSGKFGSIRPTSEGVYKNQWRDARFPLWSEVTPSWNIVLHAVCGSSTPRVACSQGRKSLDGAETQRLIKAQQKSFSGKANDGDSEDVHVKIAIHETKKHHN